MTIAGTVAFGPIPYPTDQEQNMRTTFPPNAEPMEEHYITGGHLDRMQEIARVSSRDDDPSRDVWTELGIYYRPRFNRPFVAVVIGGATREGFVPRFRAMAAGTLSRAISWLDASDLRDRLVQDIPADAAHRYPSSSDVEAERAAARRANMQRSSFDTIAGEISAECLIDGEWVPMEADQRIRIMAPGEEIAVVGPTGYQGDTLRDALDWLYPDLKTLTALSFALERDFGMPSRSVRQSLSVEAGLAAGNLGPWVRLFVTSLRYFDRAAWARQATIADVDG